MKKSIRSFSKDYLISKIKRKLSTLTSVYHKTLFLIDLIKQSVLKNQTTMIGIKVKDKMFDVYQRI